MHVPTDVTVPDRRSILLARLVRGDASTAASSGCATSGAARHSAGLADDARHALARLDAGCGEQCERCGARLDPDRVAAAPAATTCTGCARPDRFDARWCR